MRGLFRHLFVWAIVVLVAANGLGCPQCLAAPSSASAEIQHHSHEVAKHHLHVMDHTDCDHLTHRDSNHQPASDHDCGKCGGLCSVTAVTPVVENYDVIVSAQFIPFYFSLDVRDGRVIEPDPGIPKTLS